MPSDDEPFTALAFKLQTDPFVGALTFFRVYAGTVTAGSYIYNANRARKERVGRIVRLQADKREEVEKVFTGEIAAASVSRTQRLRTRSVTKQTQSFSNRLNSQSQWCRSASSRKTKADQEKMGTSAPQTF